MARRLTVLLVLALGGCAPAATTPAARTAPTVARTAPREDARVARSEARIRELEAQLGLAQATSRELRDEVRALRERDRSRATRIGAACPAVETAEVVELRDETPEPSGSRPVLRLYGAAPQPRPAASTDGVRAIVGPEAPAVLGAPPTAGVRLPVMSGGAGPEDGVPAIPVDPRPVMAGSAASSPPSIDAALPAAPAPREDAAAVEYREALRHLAERRPADALAGIDAFLARHPRHPYADNALYWRGEIHFVRRDYRRALGSFLAVVERYPDGNKVPDALLRVGLCYRRLGQAARATRAFDRLRAQYPDSIAARMASQEDA